MSTSVAFLSGKGGSGKTTLALSVADLLCRCGAKTLLVDCDLSTNGATYFYESQINEWNKSHAVSVSSFSGILCGTTWADKPMPLEVNPQMDFIPSVSEISSEWMTEAAVRANGDTESRLGEFLFWAKCNIDYDVILFDCQAGYSEFLPLLLPGMDVDLFVLEADSISASAMRSLHLKIGGDFGRAKLYQVFNKTTPEEFDIYSKIVGTFFTNIGTLLFDWKIRQAFSRSQIPDLENNSANYGAGLCDICKIIFSDQKIQKSLSNFADELHFRKLQEKRSKIEVELNFSTRKRERLIWANSLFEFLLFAFMVVCFFVAIFPLAMDQFPGQKESNYIFISLIGALTSFLILTVARSRSMSSEERRKRLESERQLKELNKELAGLENKLKEI